MLLLLGLAVLRTLSGSGDIAAPILRFYFFIDDFFQIHASA